MYQDSPNYHSNETSQKTMGDGRYNREEDISHSGTEKEIQELVRVCSQKLKLDPSSLSMRAIRGHASMKAQMWDIAVQDFTKILEVRHDDVHGFFSRGMAHFRKGGIDHAIYDFSHVLQLDKLHVMARYARAGCYNIVGRTNEAIEDYTIALEKDHEIGARNSSRLYMHSNAEKIINETISHTARIRLNAKKSPRNGSYSNVSPRRVGRELRASTDLRNSALSPVNMTQTGGISAKKREKKQARRVTVDLSSICNNPKNGTIKNPSEKSSATSTAPDQTVTNMKNRKSTKAPVKRVTIQLSLS